MLAWKLQVASSVMLFAVKDNFLLSLSFSSQLSYCYTSSDPIRPWVTVVRDYFLLDCGSGRNNQRMHATATSTL